MNSKQKVSLLRGFLNQLPEYTFSSNGICNFFGSPLRAAPLRGRFRNSAEVNNTMIAVYARRDLYAQLALGAENGPIVDEAI